MGNYIKTFSSLAQYRRQISNPNATDANVYSCTYGDLVHFADEPGVMYTKYTITYPYLVVDDFPQDVADSYFNGSLTDFKQEYIDDFDDIYSSDDNWWECTDTFVLNGKVYYMWEPVDVSYSIAQWGVYYMLTDTIDFRGLALTDNINNNFSPGVYYLADDLDVAYTPQMVQNNNYILVTAGKMVKLYQNGITFTNVVIDETITPSSNNYWFDTQGEHIVKYKLPNATILPQSMFDNCSELTYIHIPRSVTTIQTSFINKCENLAYITIDELNNIYDSRNNCNAIIRTDSNTLMFGCKNTVIPSGIEIIGMDAFYYCTGLKKIYIPNSVMEIGNNAFEACIHLDEVTFGCESKLESIGDETFKNCHTPQNIKYVGNNATNFRVRCIIQYKCQFEDICAWR